MITNEDVGLAMTKYYDAFQNKDWDIFESALDDSFSYYTDDCIVMQKPYFVDFLKKNGWKGTGYHLTDLSIITDNDLSVAKYKIAFEGSEDGKKMTVFALETTILRNSANGIRLLHTHSSNKVEIAAD
ncbi:MAG: nuclear transport factor 2 family protein [bacterium]